MSLRCLNKQMWRWFSATTCAEQQQKGQIRACAQQCREHDLQQRWFSVTTYSSKHEGKLYFSEGYSC